MNVAEIPSTLSPVSSKHFLTHRNVRHLAGCMCEFDSPETPVLRFILFVFAQLARGFRYGGWKRSEGHSSQFEVF